MKTQRYDSALTDPDINLAVATHVAKMDMSRPGALYFVPKYLEDDSAVIELLEKEFIAFQWNPYDRCFSYLQKNTGRMPDWKHVFASVPLECGAFSRAGCYALLRANNYFVSINETQAP